MNPNSKRFFGELESLRGIAALMVVLFHINQLNWVNPLTSQRFFGNGGLMVDLFFVLSGFVICHNYSQKISSLKDLGKFMFLRLGRLFPLHLFYLLIFLGVEIAKYIGESRFGFRPHEAHAFSLNSLPAFMANLLLIQPFFPSTNMSFNQPSWSIGVEFYTYLIFAVVVLFFPSKRKITFASFVIVSVAICFLSGWATAGLSPATGLSFLRCILGFFAGTLAYQAFKKYHMYLARCSEPIVWVTTFCLLLFLSLHSDSISDFMVLPLFALLIIAAAAAPVAEGGLTSRFLNSKPLRWIGAVSYSIYMGHLLILVVLDRVLSPAQKHDAAQASHWLGLAYVILAVFLVLVVSQFTYQWIERPYQKKFQNQAANWFKN